MESKRAWLLPGLQLLTPTAAIYILSWIGDRESTESYYSYLKNEEATIHILVQVVSHVSAALQISSICTTFSLSQSLWSALSTAPVDPNLPLCYLAVAFAFMAATLFPGASWAGSLSPFFILKTYKLEGPILSAFTDKTSANWDSQFQVRGPHIWNINNHCTIVNDARGLIPFCPVSIL